jgi:hypothetical protein
MRGNDRGAWLALVVVVVIGVGFIAITMMGGQVSGILSTVGASVGGGSDSGSDARADREPADDAPAEPDVLALVDGARIVRTGSMELVVEETGAAAIAAADEVAGIGGYVGESHVASGERPTARLALRIPADRWDEALTTLRGLGEVVGETTAARDVTGQLVDLAARIENLRAGEQALQAIATNASSIDDVLKVQQRLTDVRGQIEQLAGQQAGLDDQAAYGTLELTLGVEVVAVVEAAKQWDPAQEVDQATATLVDILRSVASAGIWVGIVWLPVLLALGIVGLITFVVVRRIRAVWSGDSAGSLAG